VLHLHTVIWFGFVLSRFCYTCMQCYHITSYHIDDVMFNVVASFIICLLEIEWFPGQASVVQVMMLVRQVHYVLIVCTLYICTD
jgi:glycopeptide antibiotics resistance protein